MRNVAKLRRGAVKEGQTRREAARSTTRAIQRARARSTLSHKKRVLCRAGQRARVPRLVARFALSSMSMKGAASRSHGRDRQEQAVPDKAIVEQMASENPKGSGGSRRERTASKQVEQDVRDRLRAEYASRLPRFQGHRRFALIPDSVSGKAVDVEHRRRAAVPRRPFRGGG